MRFDGQRQNSGAERDTKYGNSINRGHDHEISFPPHVPELQCPYVDTLGFRSLSGLFTAHVTGNFVTLGATLAHGLDGALSKLLALPVFCLVVFVSRLVCLKLQSRDRSPIRPMLVVKLLLFVGVAAYALYHGPFRAEEGAVTLAVGMALVSAMAIQNGLHKAHLSKAPPSTLMTGTTTQIMLDLADILADSKPEDIIAAKARVKKMGTAVATFALGCGFGALGYIYAPVIAFSLPATLAAVSLFASSAGAES